MRLTRCDISGLVTFRFSGIKRLQLSFNEETQIIIGTNGYGKSHLLSQLNPLPPNRSEYEKEGYRIIELDHDNSKFVLTSDFSNKTSPHSFIVNDEELNPSGNTNIQVDLLDEYMGFDKLTSSIMFNQLKITDMRQNERKTFFIENNPTNVGFMLSLYKKINNNIRGLNTTLQVLENRKIELKHEMLTDEEIKEYESNKDSYEKELSYAMSTIAKVEMLISTIDDFNGQASNIDELMYQIKQLRKELNTQLHEFRIIDKSNYEEDHDKLVKQLERVTTEYDLLDDSIKDIHLNILELETTLNNVSDKSILEAHELKLVNIRKKMDTLKSNVIETPLPQTTLNDSDHILSTVKSVLIEFIDIDIPLYAKIKRDRKRNHVRYYENRVAELNRIREALKREIEHLESQIIKTTIPESPCAKSLCPLYNNHISGQTYIKNELASKTKEYDHTVRTLGKYNSFIQNQSQCLMRMEVYLRKLTPLQQLAKQYGFLGDFINSDMLPVLEKEPLLIFRKIESFINASKNTHEYHELDKIRKEEENNLDNKSRITNENVNHLKYQLEKLEKEKTRLLDKQNRLMFSKTMIEKDIAIYENFITVKKRISELNEAFTKAVHIEKNRFEISQLNLFLKEMKHLKENVNSKLAQIVVTLNKQTSLKSRYDHEVISQIEKIEKRKRELTSISQALNNIPIQNTVAFINKIFTLMNQYIQIVFTYNFKLELLDPSISPDYKFRVCVEDVIVPDISLCSEAQKETLNLAFNLALRIVLKINDYPIYLDECGRTFDPKHKRQLLTLLQYLLDNKLISQLFIVNHDAIIHEGLVNSETFVLNDENVLTPASYNTHAIIN